MSDPTNLLGVLAIAAAFLALAGIATYWDHRRHPKTPAPTRQAAQGPRVGVGTKGQCDSTGCGYPASMWVIVADDLGGGVRHVCVGCHNEGIAFKWWRLSLGANPTAFDFEIADDLDRLEQLANGDGAA